MDTEFTENIKRWVNIDNQITELNQNIKSLRERKRQLNSEIYNRVNSENLHNACINISDGKLKFITTNQTLPITLKSLEKSLVCCIEDPSDVKYIMEFIKSKREIKQISDIKRTFN